MSVAWLFGLEQFGIKFGLDNMLALADELGHPERAYHTVHIAGTNGKGSVTAMVDAGLQAAGHRSARYTSPHLVDITERFVLGGQPVARAAFEEATREIRAAVDRLRERGRLETPPTFFEATTAIAFELFRRAGVEVAVFEVGMGGRLDATNIVQPLVTAITSIGFDHQRYLGDTLAAIAREKAGIIKPGVPVVLGRMAGPARAAIAATAAERGAALIPADDRSALSPYPGVRPALAGDHQIDNAVVAVRVLEAVDAAGLPVPREAIVAGLERVRWPGRLETLNLAGGRTLLLDAAHNADGAAALAAFLGGAGRRLPIVFGAMRDKDIEAMLRALAPIAAALVVTRPSNTRAADPSDIASVARTVAPGLHVVETSTAAEALTAAWSLAPQIVVAGSIFLLGDVLSEVKPS